MFCCTASRYICVIKTHSMHYLSSVYFADQPVHVSGIFVAHHQEVYCMLAGQQTVNWKAQHVPIVVYIYCIPPDDGLQIWSKHVEVDWRNKLGINCASSLFLLHKVNVMLSMCTSDTISQACSFYNSSQCKFNSTMANYKTDRNNNYNNNNSGDRKKKPRRFWNIKTLQQKYSACGM